MLRKYFASAASAILLAGGLGLGLASGSPAAAAVIHPAGSTAGVSAAARTGRVSPVRTTKAVLAGSFNGTCYVWTDGTTFGTHCVNVGGEVYGATGFCKNGQIAYGTLKTSGWSYAYCSTYGSTLNTALTTIVNGGNPLARGSRTLRPATLRARAIRGSLAASRIHQSKELNPVKAITASSSGHCSVWTDGNTFGAACSWTGTLLFPAYAAIATCSNNAGAYGPVVYSGWSYAYCSTYHAKAIGGGIDF